jgi:hypothetical protein
MVTWAVLLIMLISHQTMHMEQTRCELASKACLISKNLLATFYRYVFHQYKLITVNIRKMARLIFVTPAVNLLNRNLASSFSGKPLFDMSMS